MMVRYHADWLFTGKGQPIPNGLLIVDEGKITYAGPRLSHFVDIDLKKNLIIPGLVNAHTHLDLGECRDIGVRGQESGKPFTEWLKAVIDYRRNSTPEGRARAIQQGIAESLSSGTTLLADISVAGQSLMALQEAAFRSVVFLEVLGLADEAVHTVNQATVDWLHGKSFSGDLLLDREKLRLGISPHAPYSIHAQTLERVCDAARLMACPAAMHIAETAEELQLIEHHDGPFREFLQELGVWHPENLINSLDQAISALSQSPCPLLIHGNYLGTEQIKQLPAHLSVVYCPRTHAYFGHRPHPYQTMMDCTINVALGTDSLASNPDLSILHEARFLWQRDKKHLPPETLLQMATMNGAKALGIGDEVGTLSEGKCADFVVLPCPDSQKNPWEQLWGLPTEPMEVFVAGEQVAKKA